MSVQHMFNSDLLLAAQLNEFQRSLRFADRHGRNTADSFLVHSMEMRITGNIPGCAYMAASDCKVIRLSTTSAPSTTLTQKFHHTASAKYPSSKVVHRKRSNTAGRHISKQSRRKPVPVVRTSSRITPVGNSPRTIILLEALS